MAIVGQALWPPGCLDEAKAQKEPTQCTRREEQGAESFCREAAEYCPRCGTRGWDAGFGASELGSGGYASYWLCGPERVTWPLAAPVSSPVSGDTDSYLMAYD